jgi:hypothetical protein
MQSVGSEGFGGFARRGRDGRQTPAHPVAAGRAAFHPSTETKAIEGGEVNLRPMTAGFPFSASLHSVIVGFGSGRDERSALPIWFVTQ